MTGPGWPSERGWLVIAGLMLFVYVLTLLAFIPRLEESQLFAALAGGVVGAILRDVFGMWTSSTKAGSELAARAMDSMQGSTSPPPDPTKPQPVTIQQPPGEPVPVTETKA